MLLFVGGLMGALFSLGGTWLTLHNQAERESDDRDRLAVGTARVMIEGFDTAVLRLCEVGRTRTFLKVTPHLRPEVSASDRGLVAGELDPLEALRVADGNQAMATWESLYTVLRKEIVKQGGGGIDPHAEGLDIAVGKAMRARRALEGTADYDEEGRVVCDTTEWTYTVTR
jgi:hypothetical protein